MREKRRSLLQHIFGDDIGEMVQVMAIVPILMLFFMGVPQLIRRVSKPDAQSAVLEKLPRDSRELIQELAAVQVKTQNLISKLEADTSGAEELLHEKQQALDDLNRKIALLELTPDQRSIVEKYNYSLLSDTGPWEWLTKKTTWYEVAVATLISWFFYWLGRRHTEKNSYSRR